MIVGSSVEEVKHSLYLTVQYLIRAGFVFYIKKSDLTPTQDLHYLSMNIHLDLGKIFLPETWRQALISAATAAQRVGSYFTARTWCLWGTSEETLHKNLTCAAGGSLKVKPEAEVLAATNKLAGKTP